MAAPPAGGGEGRVGATIITTFALAMTNLRCFRRAAAVLALAGALTTAFAVAQAQGVVQDSGPTRALIVRLKDAPSHHSLDPGLAERAVSARERALALGRAAGESARWQRVLGEAGLSGSSGRRAPLLRPVGRDQQLLDFERALSRDEVERLRERLARRPDVDWVEPNRRERRLQVPPGDPLFAGPNGQWWLQPAGGSNANAAIADRLRGVANFQTAWLQASFAPVVVAVLDTGITAHADLVGRVLPGYDFVAAVEFANDGNGRDGDPSDPGDWVSAADTANSVFSSCSVGDSSWHGTIVAGMIAANVNNGIGVAGVQWGATILPVRVAGKCGAEVADIVDGMRWAAGLAVSGAPANPYPARIVNISFGGSAACGAVYQAAVDELRAAGAVVVAAAGNEWGPPTRPASCSGVVGVAGLNRDGFKNNFSNFGAALAASGIATVAGDDADGAWGGVLADTGLVTLTNLGRTAPGQPGYLRHYGTSFATPQVAGTIALMLGLNPALSHEQILRGLRLSARPHVTSPKIGSCSSDNPGRCICTTATCGVGILDAEQAQNFALQPDSYVAPVRAAAVIDNVDVDRALALAVQDRPGNTAAPAPAPIGGGGAFGGFWLMAVATATIALRATRRR
jgi:serine protease